MATAPHRWPRFRRFGTRLLFLIVGLVALAQCVTFVLVDRASQANALDRIGASLEAGVGLFERRVVGRLDDLSSRAALLSGDYAIRQLFLKEQLDPATVRSALESYTVRLRVPFMTLLGPDGSLLGDSGGPRPAAALIPFRALVQRASGSDEARANGFARLEGAGGDAQLFALLVVPIYAPPPEIVAWIGLALPIDSEFADGLKQDAQLDVTFLLGDAAGLRPAVSTLPPRTARAATAGLDASGIQVMAVPGDSYVSEFRPLPLVTPGRAAIALQRSLGAELAPTRRLERTLEELLVASLGGAALLAFGISRNLSQPLRVLAEHTEVIARGDYDRRLSLDRVDEVGQLAEAFNRMSTGLAERDRVRDLLDKNVSPEVAAQLLRDGAVLGGEEREVTVLFSDLRGFTRLSEPLPPREVLNLLNRYFDRMSRVVEAHHGVVDKYIGDAIMALFGAPVSSDQAAEDAVRAALGMVAALADLNAELAAEGLPPLAIGIGINTSRIIAGNLGSTRRLNYSVVGDGVNVAARLQDLTRTPEFKATVLVSGTTLRAAAGPFQSRPLGTLPVRGRSEPVEMHAIDGAGPQENHPARSL